MNILISIGIIINALVTMYCICLAYSEYARARGSAWMFYMFLSFVPGLNIIYMVTRILNSPFIKEDMFSALDPLLVVKYIKFSANKVMYCSDCDEAFYRWAGEHHIFAEAILIRCPKCSNVESVSSTIMSDLKAEGNKLSITEAVSYRRSLLKQHKKYKQQLSEGV